MSGRHQPIAGADSEPVWNPTEWRVTMCDRFEPEIRFDARIPAAVGRHDAINQARERWPQCAILDAREVVSA